MPSHQKLSIKQANFARYYVELGISSEAYRRAYDAEKLFWKEWLETKDLVLPDNECLVKSW